MENINKLTIIGYWQSFYEPHYPDPGSFVDDTWDAEEKAKIVAYIKAAHQMPYAAAGVSWCRFRCGIGSLGCTEFTDGKYLWPEGLLHYVEMHNVKLPREVLDHMLANKEIKPADENCRADNEWWLGQTGPNTENKTFNNPLDIGILTMRQVNDKMKNRQEHLLRIYLLDAFGVKGRLSFIDKVLAGEEAQLKGQFKDINAFIVKIFPYGLRGSFQYITKEEYGIE